jgi:tRNA-dihydrouridine synthase B
MKVGDLDIGKKLFLAPMAEVTDSSFRKICKEHGAGITFTQMVSAEGVLKNNFETLRLYSFSRAEKPIGVQVLGNDPGILIEAAKEISKHKPDLIDLNSGCPAEKVLGSNMGAALLEDPRALGVLISKLVEGAKGVPVSVKIRLGKDKNHINVLETAKIAEDSGASLLFVHARTRADKYETEPDWSWIKKVKGAVKIPVVGNGSLFTPQDVKRMIDITGCDSAMVARGALGNPFIFSRTNYFLETGTDPGEPDAAIVLETLLRHLQYLEQEFGELLAMDKAKKNCIWYFRNYKGIDSLLDRVFSIKNLTDLRSLVTEHAGKIKSDFTGGNGDLGIEKKFQRKVLFWLADENGLALG